MIEVEVAQEVVRLFNKDEFAAGAENCIVLNDVIIYIEHRQPPLNRELRYRLYGLA